MVVQYSDYIDEKKYSDISSKNDGSLECYNEDAINASILNILLTNPGTIPFNIGFGAGLNSGIFENDSSHISETINNALDIVSKYEQRITMNKAQVEVTAYSDGSTLDLYIPYVVNSTGSSEYFYKRLAF